MAPGSGAQSFENERGIELAARQDVVYHCPNGHTHRRHHSVEADVPALWECRVRRRGAARRPHERPEAKPEKPARTHWDMLLERRTTQSSRTSSRSA